MSKVLVKTLGQIITGWLSEKFRRRKLRSVNLGGPAKIDLRSRRDWSELIHETFRQYLANRNLHQLAKAGRKAAKAKHITPEDLE